MLWLFYALAAHIANGLVFVVDKSLLKSGGSISNPARYAAYSGLVAGGAAALLPFGYAAPNAFVIWWSLLAGVLWVTALWLFFIGLKFGEASRVVPVIGSAVPLFTFLFAAVFLGERLGAGEMAAVGLLVGGGALLSIQFKGTQGLPLRALMGAVLGGAAFAAHFALAKFIYDRFDPFLAGFAYVRLGTGAAALLLILWLWISGGRVKQPASTTKKAKRRRTAVAAVFFGNKLLGTGALVLQNYAISLGSVTIVNALQGTQYAFVFLLAILISWRWPHLFREELHRVALMQKVSGILLVSLGLLFLL